MSSIVRPSSSLNIHSARTAGASAGFSRTRISSARSRIVRSERRPRRASGCARTWRSTSAAWVTPGTFSTRTAISNAVAESRSSSSSASETRSFAIASARSAERFWFLRKRSMRSFRAARSNFARSVASAASAESDHSTVAFLPLPWTTTCGFFFEAVHQEVQDSSATRPFTASLTSVMVRARPKESMRCLRAAPGSATTRSLKRVRRRELLVQKVARRERDELPRRDADRNRDALGGLEVEPHDVQREVRFDDLAGAASGHREDLAGLEREPGLGLFGPCETVERVLRLAELESAEEARQRRRLPAMRPRARPRTGGGNRRESTASRRRGRPP